MRMTLLIHVVAGALGPIAGYLPLWASKGAPLHRRAGMVFVYTMLTMCTFGFVVAAGYGMAPAMNVPAALVTAYLVATGLIAVRPSEPRRRWLDVILMLVALGVGVVSLRFGFEAIAGGGKRNGLPAFPFFMFGLVGTLAGASDLRVVRRGALRGTARLARHLWRMSFALLIAALSFFLGQADELPKPLRIMPLLSLPVLMVLVTMLYWLWRVRVRRSVRGIVERAPAAAPDPPAASRPAAARADEPLEAAR